MTRPLLKPGTMFVLLLVSCTPVVRAQPSGDFRMNVTYVTTRQLYFDAGKEEGVTPGDSVIVLRGNARIARARVSSVAPHSCAAQIIAMDSLCRPGDVGIVVTEGHALSSEPSSRDTVVHARSQVEPPPPAGEGFPAPRTNIVRGRVAFQYLGEIAADSRLNVQEPALLASVNVANLEATGLTLSLNARAFHDLTDAYVRFGAGSRTRIDVYAFQLGLDRPTDHFGFSLGRMVSRYVGGLGVLDGGQVFARAGGVVGGVVAGRGIEQSALGIAGAQVKSALFVGYQNVADMLHSYEGTIAYARQTLHGNLDRQFFALQGSAVLGPSFQAFGSAEIDQHNPSTSRQASPGGLTNASLFLNYYHAWWLSGSLSFDETRPVYLPETMKSIPDSLFSDALQHGFRASVTVRPSRTIALTGSAGYRARQGDPRPSHTLTGEARVSDLLDARINASVRYANSVGSYLNGNDLTLSLDRTLFSTLDVMLRYDHYAFGIGPLHQVYLTQTFTLDTYCGFSKSVYGILRGDYVLDNTMNSIQFQVEIGVRL